MFRFVTFKAGLTHSESATTKQLLVHKLLLAKILNYTSISGTTVAIG